MKNKVKAYIKSILQGNMLFFVLGYKKHRINTEKRHIFCKLTEGKE